MKETVLDVQNLSVSFDSNRVLDNLSFSIRKGEVVAIVGPNGAGKSVLFRTLMGLVPHLGKMTWAQGLKISYVPQKLIIEKSFPITVKDFLQLKSKNYGHTLSTLESVGLTSEHNDKSHLDHLLNQRMGWLSGGQFQRVLIAWAILDNPDVLLFDEPTAGIDVGGEETIYNLLKNLNNKRNLTILIISHDLNVVYEYANNVLYLNKEKTCFGPPSNVLDPQALAKLYGDKTKFYKHER